MTTNNFARKAAVVAAFTGIALAANLAAVATASAGEGHWSIGKGIQCKLIQGKVVCSKLRP